MSLSSVVQLRISAKQLRELTNPDNSPASTISTSLIDEAVKSVKALFYTRTGVVLDDTTPNEDHLELGVRGVLFMLRYYKGFEGLEPELRERNAWYRSLYEYAQSSLGGLNWVTPTSNSGLSPTPDNNTSGLTVKPAFDNSAFYDTVPNAPGGSRDTGGLS